MAVVLLIEDVSVVRTLLRKFLERGGHKVTECAGGAEAWARLDKEHFDIILTDLWMKDGGGVEFIRRLRAAGRSIPVIAVTSGSPDTPQPAAQKDAREAGADSVIFKPVTATVLLSAVAEFAKGHHSEMEKTP